MKQKRALSTEPYKGVRDFYPADMWIQRYIFDVWSATSESFGYEQYDASILEPAELFRSKSGEEIVNEQTYTFTDRGDREVTLRPEMTPTAARMVTARRRELTFPLRWYSIPNLFRYERPQRGRLREHWQLNCDIFGADTTAADIETVLLADALMRGFGATDTDYEIRINHMGILNEALAALSISEEKWTSIRRLIDRQSKTDDFEEEFTSLTGISLEQFEATLKQTEHQNTLNEIVAALTALGVTNIVPDSNIVRGQDYYTGMLFEVFDAAPENKRSLFGGGRYDELMELFGGEHIPAVGFGMGDVTIVDFLNTHNLLPDAGQHVDLFIGTHAETHIAAAHKLAAGLREAGLNVIVNVTNRKIGDQLSFADKKRIPFALVVGDDEVAHNAFKLKEMESGTETTLTADKIAEHITAANPLA